MKALVWFWLIDETLCANLLALVIMRIGKHIPSDGVNGEDHGDQVLGLGKEEREKQNGLKAMVKSIGPFCFGDQDTIESVITFRIDGHTIKRGALIGQLDI